MDKYTALIAACRSGNPVAVATLLEAQAPVNVQDADGWTPLHIAVDRGDTKTVKLLLDAKADTSVRMADGTTSLHLAVSARKFGKKETDEIVMLLLDAKADTLARDKNGERPVDLMKHKFGPVYDRLEVDMAEAEDLLLDKLLEAAAKDARPLTPAQTPQDALRNFARAVYRMDRPAQLACFAGDTFDMTLGTTLIESVNQNFVFRNAMIAAYGRKGWLEWQKHDKGMKATLGFPLIDEDAIKTAQIVVTGDMAICEDAEQLVAWSGEVMRFVRERGEWRISIGSATPSGADRDKFRNFLASMTAAIKELLPEIGKPGVTAQDINHKLGEKIGDLMGFRIDSKK